MGQLRQAPAGEAGTIALVFQAGPLFCALPLAEVIETMRPLPTRPLAGTPSYVRGLTILRGEPAPVIDMTRLLTGVSSGIDRYVAVHAGRGPVACATGPVLGVRTVHAVPPEGPSTLFTGASRSLVAAVGTVGTEPLLVLRSIRTVPDEVWDAAGRDRDTAEPGTAQAVAAHDTGATG
ncbi:chemotaxis protein CheW [Actinoplanes sp. SE50]|uniref:chemotaxis protein CheW n=1 Tax=unclassified Actinoplanes TaxID=2626549 RepID=UPI00023ECD1D|nr:MULTISPECIES: chemotaxis protein CheW [unclassified Actinoplanes]AEV86023.1 Chemotaxis protein cheV [Actinoplanes sp. SE50/110]ATO84421.1 chemotaxis protein CheW [Actinoplanes sp. SE50]SLM01831.1 chemotaxis protein CheW [Actinoplanes sp. SE50/110]